ncbi:MAG: hypothetical protein QW201_00855 [Thermoproteota archaeon]
MSNRYLDKKEIQEDELQEESETPPLKKTFRRILFTIINPKKAMAYVSFDPDLLIIPIIIAMIALFSFLHPTTFLSKLILPEDIILKIPPSGGQNTTQLITFGEFKAELQKMYVASNIMFYMLSVALSFTLLYALSKVFIFLKWGEDGQYKATLSGVFYASSVSVLLGFLWLALVLATPAVSIEVHRIGNESYIKWFNESVVEATPTSVLEYFGVASNQSRGQLVDAVIRWGLPYLSKIWQSFIFLFLEKYNHNLSLAKSFVVVVLQQLIMWFVFGL